MQSEEEVEYSLNVIVPFKQLVQAELPDLTEYLLSPQGAQAVLLIDPLLALEVPGEHWVQLTIELAPVMLEYRPEGHKRQAVEEVALLLVEYMPFGHGEQIAKPLEL